MSRAGAAAISLAIVTHVLTLFFRFSKLFGPGFLQHRLIIMIARRRYRETSGGMGSAQMARFMKEDAQRWREAIGTAGLKPGAL